MLPFIGALVFFAVLALLVLGERVFERGRKRRKAPKQLRDR
jgi:hypothetical protein